MENATLIYLQNLNFQERLGFFAIRYSILLIVGFVLLLITPFIIYLGIYSYEKSSAESYLAIVKEQTTLYQDRTNKAVDFLKNKKDYFKEYLSYTNQLDAHKKLSNRFSEEVRKLADNFEQEKFSVIQDAQKVGLNDSIASYYNQFEKIFRDLEDVVNISNFLDRDYNRLIAFQPTIPDSLKQKNQRTQDIAGKGKTEKVKVRGGELFRGIQKSAEAFEKNINASTPFTLKKDIGRFNLNELKNIQVKEKETADLLQVFITNLKEFDVYYQRLKEQYYTLVTEDGYDESTVYEREHNPAYREWTETEYYSAQETRYRSETKSRTVTKTRSVYKGSRVNSKGKQENIYGTESYTTTENYTDKIPYTETVQKSRSVSKNNGQPVMIDVPYAFFKHYYLLFKTTPKGNNSEKIYVGSKHAKHDSNLTSWNYENNQRKGYMTWKQLWNDEVLTGFDLQPHLEE